MSLRTHALVFATLFSVVALADEAPIVTIEPVISEGTPAESLKFDPIVPAYQGKPQGNVSTGNIAKDLANDLPFHTNSNLKPGNEVGVIGIGKGPEETDVNLLGIPINRPQGGGADLATFPQYFWSSYSYQIGPSLGAFDPRGVGGSLTLRLWTQENLGTESSRATAFASGRHIQQFSYGRSGERYAALVGLTTDSVFGPALSFSAIPLATGSTKITTHLIYSDTDAKGFVSEHTNSPTGSQHTYRLIPVLQIDKKFDDSVLKTSFFYDGSYVQYDDSANPSQKQIKKIAQIGNESAWIRGSTRIGFGLRSLSYSRTAQTSADHFPSEQTLNLQVSHGFRFATSENSDVLVEPTLAGYSVTQQGFFPTGSIGARHGHRFGDGGKLGEFIRVSYTKRFSSLLDRYYSYSQAAGPMTVRVLPNPGLRTENIRSTELGVDYGKEIYKTQLTLFARDYKHARYMRETVSASFLDYQILNAGDAWVVGGTHSQDWKVLPILDFGTRATYQRSQIEELNARFPYSPTWVGIVKADLHDSANRYGLEIVNKGATNFASYSETSSAGPQSLTGYYYLDLFVRAEVHSGITLIGGVEDVFDRKIQYRTLDPDNEGRVWSLAANAVF